MLQKYFSQNDNLIVYVNGELLAREDAKISVLDSVVQGGDAVWEGLRLYNGKIFALNDHLERLENSAKALMFAGVPSMEEIKEAISDTLLANKMQDNVHIRLTVSRGLKTTSGMDPRLNVFGCGLIILAEYKPPVYRTDGLKLITSHIRRNSPQFLDSKIHHNNLLNNILAKIQANISGVDDALMLDERGFLSETNATNIFIIKNGVLLTPFAHNCLPGITRKYVMEIAEELNIPNKEADISLTEIYSADGAFTTGTMGELSPVTSVDGREINIASNLNTFSKIQNRFSERSKSEGFQIV